MRSEEGALGYPSIKTLEKLTHEQGCRGRREARRKNDPEKEDRWWKRSLLEAS